MRNNSTRLKGKENFNLTISMFWVQHQQKWREKRRCTQSSCRHGIRRIWKLYTKWRPAGKLTWYEHSRDHLDYHWWDNIQRSSPYNTGQAKAVIMLRLEKCEYRHALGAFTYSIPHCLENVRKHKRRYSSC